MTKGNPVYLNRPVQKLYPVELNENGNSTEERKDNKVEKEVDGYDNQKGRMEINEKRKTEGRVRWKVVCAVGEQQLWMHDGKHKSCLTLTGSKGGVCRIIICNTIFSILLMLYGNKQ